MISQFRSRRPSVSWISKDLGWWNDQVESKTWLHQGVYSFVICLRFESKKKKRLASFFRATAGSHPTLHAHLHQGEAISNRVPRDLPSAAAILSRFPIYYSLKRFDFKRFLPAHAERTCDSMRCWVWTLGLRRYKNETERGKKMYRTRVKRAKMGENSTHALYGSVKVSGQNAMGLVLSAPPSSLGVASRTSSLDWNFYLWAGGRWES